MDNYTLGNVLLVTDDNSESGESVSVWDAISGAPLFVLKGEKCSKGTLKVSNHAMIVAAVCAKPIINKWNFTRKQQSTSRFMPGGPVNAFTFSGDSKYCAAGIDSNINIWQCSTGDLFVFDSFHHARVVQVEFSVSMTYLVSADDDGCIAVWSVAQIFDPEDPNPREPLWSTKLAGAKSIYFRIQGTPPRAILVVASNDGHFAVYDLSKGKQLVVIRNMEHQFFSLTVNRIGTLACCGVDRGSVAFVDMALTMNDDDRQKAFSLMKIHSDRENGMVDCLSLSMDDKLLASGTRSGSIVITCLVSMTTLMTMRVKGSVTNLLLEPWSGPECLDNDPENCSQAAIFCPLTRSVLTKKQNGMIRVALPLRKQSQVKQSKSYAPASTESDLANAKQRNEVLSEEVERLKQRCSALLKKSVINIMK